MYSPLLNFYTLAVRLKYLIGGEIMVAKRTIAYVLAVALLLGSGGVALAIDLGEVLEAFGIAYAVRVFAPQINSFTNSLLLQRGVQWEETTKVVPIISVGTGGYVGAAQVVGPTDNVGRVAAVGQGELRVGSVRLNALFPIDNLNPTRGISRVDGVGVSAIIDFRI